MQYIVTRIFGLARTLFRHAHTKIAQPQRGPGEMWPSPMGFYGPPLSLNVFIAGNCAGYISRKRQTEVLLELGDQVRGASG